MSNINPQQSQSLTARDAELLAEDIARTHVCDNCGGPLPYLPVEVLSVHEHLTRAIRAGVVIRSGQLFCGKECGRALPELTPEMRAKMESIPDDIVEQLWNKTP